MGKSHVKTWKRAWKVPAASGSGMKWTPLLGASDRMAFQGRLTTTRALKEGTSEMVSSICDES